MSRLQSILASVLLAATGLTAAAQDNGSNSPYSRYGFGLLGDGANAFNKGMAGTGYAMRNGTQINTKNPASYSAIDSLSFLFDFGMSLQNGHISQNGQSVNAKNSSIDYITGGFRISPRLGMVVGLLPYSTIGYDTSSQEDVQSGNETTVQTTRFYGDGGLHETFLGIGWAPIKSFSMGVNAGYMWGELSHTVLMSFDNSSISSNRQIYDTRIRTYRVDFGLQYEQPINAENTLLLGLTYSLGHDINNRAHYISQKITSSTVAEADTLTIPNAYQLPHTFGVGLTWSHKNSLRVGVDYTFQKWSSVKYPQFASGETLTYYTDKGSFTDRHRISIGAEYVRNAEGLRWRDRVRYRAGFAFSTPYAKIDGRDGPRDYTASIGAAIPIINLHNNRSVLNVSAQYERVQPRFSGMITENYFRLSIGLTFNERWFMKWKAE